MEGLLFLLCPSGRCSPRAPKQGHSSYQGPWGALSSKTQTRHDTETTPDDRFSCGLSSRELGQDHRECCLPSVPEPLGQRDRPEHGKRPLSPWAPHRQAKMQAALVLRARAAGQTGRGAAIPAEPQPPTTAGGQAWAPGRTGGPRGACGQRRSHLRLPHLSRASPHRLARPIWYQAPRCTHPQAPSRPPSGSQGPECAEGSHPPVVITCRGSTVPGVGLVRSAGREPSWPGQETGRVPRVPAA